MSGTAPISLSASPSSSRLVATMAAAGLASGLVLVGVFLSTKPRIERNQAEAMTAAVFRVLPGTATIVAYEVDGGRPRRYEGPEGTIPKGESLFAGFGEDGALRGYAIPADGPGFMDTVKLIYGFDPSRQVIVGMEVLDSRETPGLGDKILYDADFLANFADLVVAPAIVPVKKGKKTKPYEVDCITGATISSEAVVKILNKSTTRWLPILETIKPTQETEADGPTARR